MGMPLIMLGSDYSRQHIRFGAETDPGFVGPPRSLMPPGSKDWWDFIPGLASQGLDVLQSYLLSSKKVASTPQERDAIAQAASQYGITLSQATPYLIGGGALLIVVILLMSKKRR